MKSASSEANRGVSRHFEAQAPAAELLVVGQFGTGVALQEEPRTQRVACHPGLALRVPERRSGPPNDPGKHDGWPYSASGCSAESPPQPSTPCAALQRGCAVKLTDYRTVGAIDLAGRT